MSDNTEPVVTQEDRDAADQLRIYLLRKMDLELEDDVIGEFEKHFAAHRADAVAKREKEIVEIIREAERQRFAKCLLEDPSTVGVYFTAGELITKLQNGGGA